MLKLLFDLFICICFLLLTAHFLFTLLTLFFKGAPYVPTPRKRIKEILELAEVNQDTTSLDLGSGDGRVVRAFAKAGVKKAIGLELNPIIFVFSKLLSFINPSISTKSTEIKFKNIWDYNLKEVDVLTIFFVPTFMDKLEEKILAEMKEGSKIISYRYECKKLKQIKNISKLYLYKIQ